MEATTEGWSAASPLPPALGASGLSIITSTIARLSSPSAQDANESQDAMALGSKSAHWNRGGKGGKKGLLTTIRGRRSHLLWSSPDPSPVLAFARRQKEVAGRGSSPEGADQRREEGSSRAAPAGRGGGSNGGSGGLTLVAAMEGARLGRDSGVSESGRGRNVWRWEPLLSSNPSGLWASQFLTGPQTI